MNENTGNELARTRRRKKGGLASQPIDRIIGLLRTLSRGMPQDPNLEVKL